MTAPRNRATTAPHIAALALGTRPARDGAGYAARERPAPGDPLTWLAEAPQDRRDEDENDDDTLQENER